MKYLINETTREERELIVEKALAISLSGAKKPSQKTLDLVNEYIDGNIELEEVQKQVIELYKEGV